MEKDIFKYEKNSTGLTLKKFISGSDEIVIPGVAEDARELSGLPVTAIGAECFKENGIMITSITVPESVKILEHDAFAYCVSLQRLILPETIEFLGADYLIASGLEKAYIPACVNVIERPELIDREFVVSAENKIFSTDGFGLYETRDNKKVLIAVNASDERDFYRIEDGTRGIAPGALRDISTIKRLEIPSELDMIEEGSLSFTGGRASGSHGYEEIIVSPENKTFLVKYDCLCRREEGDKLSILRYFGGNKCVLGEDVLHLGAQCFKNTRLEEITFADEALSIGDEAFSGCLIRYAYIGDKRIFFGEEDQFTTEDFVLNFGKNGRLYDFSEYDDFLKSQYLTEPRIRMIANRVKNLSEDDSDIYNALKEKLGSDMKEVITLLSEAHNTDSLNDLGDMGLFTSENIDEYTELSLSLEDKEMTAWFLSYKNKNIGFKDELSFL